MDLDISDTTRASIRAAQARAAAGDVPGAVLLYRELLGSLADDDYEGAAVAHMYALIVEDPMEKLAINEDALERAERVSSRFPKPLFASLYANLGYSKIELGEADEARRWYERAAAVATGLDDDAYGQMVRAGIEAQLAMLEARTTPSP